MLISCNGDVTPITIYYLKFSTVMDKFDTDCVQKKIMKIRQREKRKEKREKRRESIMYQTYQPQKDQSGKTISIVHLSPQYRNNGGGPTNVMFAFR